jgi:predicted Zn-dependent protease
LERGRAEYASENISAARSDFETYSRMATDRPEGNYFLGILDCSSGNYASAVTHLKQALASDPSLADAYYYLGQAYFHLGHREEAEDALKHCLSLNGTNEDAKKLLSELSAKEP